jgi:hypothetical protein
MARTFLLAAIERQRDAVWDWDVVVDDARTAIDRDVLTLQMAVRERDRAARYLQFLIELATETPDAVERLC